MLPRTSGGSSNRAGPGSQSRPSGESGSRARKGRAADAAPKLQELSHCTGGLLDGDNRASSVQRAASEKVRRKVVSFVFVVHVAPKGVTGLAWTSSLQPECSTAPLVAMAGELALRYQTQKILVNCFCSSRLARVHAGRICASSEKEQFD